MKYAILIVACILFISCNENKDFIKEYNFHEEICDLTNLPFQLEYMGKVLDCKKWQDGNGENYFLLTAEDIVEESDEYDYFRTLTWHGYHYTKNGDEFKLVREFIDYVKKCEFDLLFEPKLDYFKLSDLDSNSIGEVIIIYIKGCRSDVSPDDMKLLMFENGEKFSIRGSTIVDYGDGKVGGDKKTGAEFKNAPEIFLKYANVMFDRALGIK